jgi:hypothetical protein
MGDIEGTLGSGLASSGEEWLLTQKRSMQGRVFRPETKKPTNESADVDNVTESGESAEHRVPEKKK